MVNVKFGHTVQVYRQSFSYNEHSVPSLSGYRAGEKKNSTDLDVQFRLWVHIVEELLVVLELLIPLQGLCVPEVIPKGSQYHLCTEQFGLLSVLIQQHARPFNEKKGVKSTAIFRARFTCKHLSTSHFPPWLQMLLRIVCTLHKWQLDAFITCIREWEYNMPWSQDCDTSPLLSNKPPV